MAGVELTHLDRVFWPESRLRKRDLVEYYQAMAPVLLPHVRNRPLTIKRHYTVPRGPFEWVKDAPPETPGWIRTCPQPAKSRGGKLVRYPLVNSQRALLWMVEYGCIDLHVWTSRCDRPERPDFVLLDLDPAEDADFGDVVRAALFVRQALQQLGLSSVVRTTGGEGMHVLVPLARRHTHQETRTFAQALGAALAGMHPDLGVRVDAKMNGHGQQIVSAYSVRPLPEAPVATPLAWEEVEPGLDPATFTMQAVLDRVRRVGDLHAPLLRGRQRLPL